jgi:2-dehydropantoate 2-reductase
VRILVIGAGAIGGYFGGRLLEAGRDVTFLVRPRRAAQLAEMGLAIASRFGDVVLPSPPTVTADMLRQTFDVVLLACKAYDLAGAIDALTPAVGPNSVVLPLLNGMRHLDVLDARFGAQRVLGGSCLISANLEDSGRINHRNDAHRLMFGERTGGRSARIDAIAALLAGARFDSRASDTIVRDMWEKWVFLATLAGMTCLMRAAVGDIVAAGGADLTAALLEECLVIAAQNGQPPRPEFSERVRAQLTASDSSLAASMLSDIERGARTEADHVLGDLLHRRGPSAGPDCSLLRIAYAAVKSYEARHAREKR